MGHYEVAAEFRSLEKSICKSLDIEQYHSWFDMSDMTQLGIDHVREVEKIIDRKDVDVNWESIPDSVLTKMRREIKLNKIFKN